MTCNEKTQWYDVTEDSTFVVMSRLKTSDDTYITQAEVNTVTVIVYDITDETDVTQVGDTTTPDVEDVIFDILQTDTRWSNNVDSVGYNFAHKVSVPDADKQYSIDVTFDLTNGDTFKRKFKVRSQ